MGPSTSSGILKILAWDFNEMGDLSATGDCRSVAAFALHPVCLFSLALNTAFLVSFVFLPSEVSSVPCLLGGLRIADGGISSVSPSGVSPLHPDKGVAMLPQLGFLFQVSLSL